MSDNFTHVVLLEIVNTDRFRNFRSEYFPFFAGLFSRLGYKTTCLCIGVQAKNLSSASNIFIYDLPDPDRETLFQQLAELNPTHVLLNERLEEELWTQLRKQFGSTSFLMVGHGYSDIVISPVSRWLGFNAASALAPETLLEEVSADFSKRPLNELALNIRPFIHLPVGPECLYLKEIDKDLDFKDVDLMDCARQWGCSFCYCSHPKFFAPGTPVVELTLRQVAAARATANRAIHDWEFLIRGADLPLQIDTFCGALLAEGIDPADYHISIRIDHFLQCEARFRNALTLLAKSGNRLIIWNMGLENFSPEENRRFNKGIDEETICRGIALLNDLKKDYPESFDFTGFGFILFTPWTTIADLRHNIAAFKKWLSLSSQFFIGTALQLLPGVPITELARAEGLLTESFVDLPPFSGCINSWDGYELPWRFKHPEVAVIYAISRRLSSWEVIPKDDAQLRTVQDWYKNLSSERKDLLLIFEALCEVVARNKKEKSTERILGLLEVRLGLSDGKVGQDRKDSESYHSDEDALTAKKRLFWKKLGARLEKVATGNAKARTYLRRLSLKTVRLRQIDDEFGLDIQLNDGISDFMATIESRKVGSQGLLLGDKLVLYLPAEIKSTPERHIEDLGRLLNIAEFLFDGLNQNDKGSKTK